MLLDHLSAALALTTFALLPGIALLFSSRCLSLEWIGMVVSISFGVNTFVVMLMAISGYYSHFNAWLWLIALCLASGVLLGRSLPRIEITQKQQFRQGDRFLSWLLAPIFAVVAYKSFFLPFYAWDSVASWNRWARGFALQNDYFQHNESSYPQYLSWGFSFPYKLAANPTLESYAHAFAFFHVLILFVALARLSRLLGIPGSLAFACSFVTLGVSSYAGTGYADIPATAYSCLAATLVLELAADSGHILFNQRSALFRKALLAGLAVGTSFMFKVLAPLLPVTLTLICTAFPSLITRRECFKRMAIIGSAAWVIVLPWLLASNASINSPMLKYVTVGIHGDASFGQVIWSGLHRFVFGLTSFNLVWLEGGILVLGIIAVTLGARRSRAVAQLTIAGILGTAVWLATVNYDTRALMPFLTALLVASLAGLSHYIKHLGKLTSYSTFIILQVLLVAAFVVPEVFPDLSIRGRGIMDWKQGRRWFETRAFSSRAEKLKHVQPSIASLELWKSENPAFEGTIWTNTMLLACVDPWKVDGGGKPMLKIEWEGEVLWKRGDMIIATAGDNKDQKLDYPELDRLAGSSTKTWGPWFEAAQEAGVIRLEWSYADLRAFRIVLDPP